MSESQSELHTRIVREYAEYQEKQRSKSEAEDTSDATDAIPYTDAPIEPPRPLRRELSPADPFPLDALGAVLGDGAKAIVDKVQCPDALAANSVLAAASLAAQAHADVVLPTTGRAHPLALFIISVAASGERKTTADRCALSAVRKREKELREQFEVDYASYAIKKRAYDVAVSRAEKTKGDRAAVEAALRNISESPRAPMTPVLTCDSPTLEGLHKLFMGGHPSLGLFSDEAGAFISGASMADEKKLATAAGLSALWDGSAISRVRAGDGTIVMPGRRLAAHLMCQPDAAARMLADPVLSDQGLLSRFLVAAPATTAGTRFQRSLNVATEPALRHYSDCLLDLLEMPPALAPGASGGLDPRPLEFTRDAARTWLAFADHVEGMLGVGGALAPVRGFASKLPEHVGRIAAVLAMVDDKSATAIAVECVERAVLIADFYSTEALRLFEASAASPGLRQAETLLAWLKGAWREPLIGLSAIYRLGPNSIREAATAKRAVAILEDHGWLRRHKGGPAMVDGKPVREAWTLVRED